MAAVKDKKDVSVLLEAQIPEFITSEHPKFKYFIEKYYEFMESQQVYFTGFTFNEDRLVLDSTDGSENAGDKILCEDDTGLQLESDRDTLANANLQFLIGETLTGNTSAATAVVTGTKGNTLAFIKPTNEATFKIDEKITGSTSRAYAVLANGVSANVFPDGSIESFRSRGAIAATRDLENMQDIDKTNDGLVDDAWKKEFYTNIPRTAKADRKKLLKRMTQVYRSKGNEASFFWLFRTLYAKEDIEFYYPKKDLLNLSAGKWTLDKAIKIVTSGATNLSLFDGRKIIGEDSKCTAVVESLTTTFAGALEITELSLSDVVQGLVDDQLFFFKVNETITSEVDDDGLFATATTTGLLQTVTIDVGGTNYTAGDEIYVSGGGGQDAKARVATIADAVVEGITIVDSGDGFVVGDVLDFVDEGSGGSGASATIGSVIKTGDVLVNQEAISTFKNVDVANSDYGSTFIGHNANTHLYGNSSLIFVSAIKASSAYAIATNGAAPTTAAFDATAHILAGDRIAKLTSVNTSSTTITQAVKNVTLSAGITEQEKLDIVGGKLTYANANTNIITGFSSNTVLTVRDTHTIGSGETVTINYASNTYWGTIISANTTAFMYSLGSHYRDSDLDAFSANNFVNDDNIIVYNSKFTKLGAAAAASGVDGHMMHSGVYFQAGNTPSPVANASFTMTAAHGGGDATAHVSNGAFNMTSVNVGAISTVTLTSGGEKYESSPLVTVSNNYMNSLGNALDVMGAHNSLLNLNLHSYTTGTITQTGNVVTLSSEGTFPDANSGLLQITYANGLVDQVTAVTNSSSLRVSSERLIYPAYQTYELTYMAVANNFTKNTLLYNEDYSARARILDFIDKSTSTPNKAPIATGNTVLRLDMLTAQDFGGVIEYLLLESKAYPSHDHDVIKLEDGGQILIEDSVIFMTMEDGDYIVEETDGTRIYEEATTGDRVTAYNGTASAYTTGTMAQSGTTVTGVGTTFPNDSVRGTITYHDDATSIITGWTNTTSFTVADSKTVGAGNTYSISYNPALTWGVNRTVTAAGSGTGNKTVTITDAGHYLRTGDKTKITGCGTAQVNGIWPITVLTSNTYSYTLPENGAASLIGSIRSFLVSSAWTSTSNAVTMDTSPKGNNAVIEVSAIAIGAIKTAEVYSFGAGYTSAPTLSTTTGDRNAELTAGLGAYATYPGYYTGTTGLLSGVPKMQDNKYYQNFSYVLKTDFDVNDYRDIVKRLVHPSGMIMFGELAIRSKVSAAMFDAATNNVDDLVDNSGKRYHTLVLTQNAATANVQYKSSNTQPELEIFTASHPWQAMNARLDTADDTNLLEENYRDVTIARTNSTTFTVTDTLHGLVVSDTIQISGFPQGVNATDYWDGKYIIQTIATTNTYTITPYRGDPGAGVTADPYFYIVLDSTDGSADAGDNILTEHESDSLIYEGSVEYLKVETLAFANAITAKTYDWETPFNGPILDEGGNEILLERGGSYLYPTLQFPVAESGSISIDMSFNSDILLEDSGYLLDETSGGMGTGPARYISLEEDTEGPNHQYESIPIVDAVVSYSESVTTGWLIMLEDDSGAVEFETEGLGEIGIRMLTEYSHVTTSPEGRVKHSVDGFSNRYIDHFSMSILDRIKHESGDILEMEDNSQILQEGDPSVLMPDKEVEFDLYDTMGWHLRGEDDSYITNEDKTRTILDLFTNRSGTKTITQLGSTQPATVLTNDPSTSGGANMGSEIINDYKDYNTGLTFGMQVFRPHYTSQWKSPTTDISFTHDQMTLEGEVGLLLLEDDVLVTDHLLFEDGGHSGTDLLNSGESYSELIRLEDQGTGNNILHEDGETQILMEASRILSSEYLIHQSWKVLPAYQYSRIQSRLLGQISIPHNSTTVTGTSTTFTTQVAVGEIFQTADENLLIEEDDDIRMETDERLQHEDVVVDLVKDYAITSQVGSIAIEDFIWYISKEDTTKTASVHAAAGSLPDILGTYLPLNTADDSFWIVGEDTNDELKVGLEDGTGAIEREHVEWETNDIQLEDGSKYLLTDPGEFKIASITNDTTLVVTRKHWGGTDNVIWRQ